MKLMSNNEVDKLKLNNNEVDKKKKRLRKKKRTSIQKRKLIDTHFDIVLSLMKYQPLLKSSNKLKLFKE